jgi:hypothetical protein
MKSDYDPKVSTRDAYFSQKTYLNPAEYYPLTPHDLTGRMSENHLKTIMQACAPSMIIFTLPTRPWTTLSV